MKRLFREELFPGYKDGECYESGIDFFARQPDPIVFRLCAGCSVREACENYALHNESFGVWAGLTEKEIRSMRRHLGIEPPSWNDGIDYLLAEPFTPEQERHKLNVRRYRERDRAAV